MSSGNRLWAVVLVAFWFGLAAGCDRDESASNQPSSPQTVGNGDDREPAPDEAGGDDAGDDAGNAPAAPKATIPTPDVPVPPTAEGEVVKLGFVIFVAKDNAKNVADFYQKGMAAKGWKAGRNKTTSEVSNLTNVVQEYTKGNEVVTVLLQEQPTGDGSLTSGQVMDIPLPPNAERAVPIAGMASMEVPGGPDAVLAWFDKGLSARGWSGDKPRDQSGTKTQSFRKGNRAINLMAKQYAGQKNSSVQLQHLAYQE